MSEPRNLHRDLFALILLAVVLFLGASLTTYDAADPVPRPFPPLSRWYTPDIPVYPQNDVIQNACGKLGALASDLLLNGLGLGAYYFVVSLAALDGLLLRRKPVAGPFVRACGWFASLIGLTALANLLVPSISVGPVIGSGGYLGALAAACLHQHFATAGSVILAASLVAGGLLLCTDYAMLRAAAFAGRVTVHGGRTVLRTAASRRRAAPRETPAMPVIATDCEQEEKDALSVRIRRTVESSDTETEEVDDGDDSGDAEDAADPNEAIDAAADGVTNARPAKGAKQSLRLIAGPEGATARGDSAEKPAGPRVRNRKTRNERDDVITSLNEAAVVSEPSEYELPRLDLLIAGDEISYESQDKEVRRKAKILEQTFADFGFQVKVVEIETGPVIAQYEVQLEAGLRLSRITGLADDLAIALRVPSVRIVAPIPGKNTVGIEVPNAERQIVRLREVVEECQPKAAKMRIPLFLGKDVSGRALPVDLSTLPHLLIAGRTGTGKSVCLNAIICSILMTRRPDEVRLLLIDPKMVELSCYGRLPHLMHPVVTDMRKAEAILAWAVDKMEERYALLARAGVRHISSYNQLSEEELMERLEPENDEERANIPLQLPFIVIVADEMADLMMTAGKEVEQHIIRLAQKSRAVGIHLILATQKPTVDVITGLIKSNLPARIAFQVASRTDSRVVLDEMGADKLLGNGDMLFLWPGTSTLLRGQGTYLSDDEIERVVDAVSTGEQHFVHELVNIRVSDGASASSEELKKRDELYEQAIDVLVREGRGSVSLLQRALGIGYGRAARLIDYMEEDGIVGTYAGSQAREVLISLEDWEARSLGGPSAPPRDADPPAAPRRSNRLRPGSSGWDEDRADDRAHPTGRGAVNPLKTRALNDHPDEVLDVESEDLTEDLDEALEGRDAEWDVEDREDDAFDEDAFDGEDDDADDDSLDDDADDDSLDDEDNANDADDASRDEDLVAGSEDPDDERPSARRGAVRRPRIARRTSLQ